MAQGHEAIVANARAVRSIATSDTKNDRRDAEQLARLGRADLEDVFIELVRREGGAVAG